MSRKILAVAAAVILAAIGIVGGTLAWFTDSDSAENQFTTGKIDIAILENNALIPENDDGKAVLVFDGLMMPGTTFEKKVAVQSLAESAWIRAQIAVAWGKQELSPEMLELTFGDDWIQAGEWYYYKVPVGGGNATTALINSVKLKTDADNDYAGQTATITVTVQAVQRANNVTFDEIKSAVDANSIQGWNSAD